MADAERLAPTDRDLSMLLAAEAARRQPDVASAGALATALLTEPDFLRYEGDTNGERVYETPGDHGDRPRTGRPSPPTAPNWPSPTPTPARSASSTSSPGPKTASWPTPPSTEPTSCATSSGRPRTP